MLNLRLDQMLMAGLLGPQILGLYVTSVAWSNAVAPLVNAVAATLLPRVAGAAPEQQGMLLAQSTRLGLILALLLAFSMALLAPLVIPLLFGAAFAPAVPAAVILCLAAGVAAFNQVLEAAAQSLARPRYVLMAESVGLIATISLLWLLLPSLQLIGAALASIMSYTIVSIVLIGNITKQAGLTIRALLVPRQEDIAALVARLNLRGNSWLGDLARWRDASQDRDQADVNED
jgi:O-antigen/teichoic acid export membrane protein